MDPLSMAVIGSAIVGAGANVYGQRKANRANLASAREQMAFQERMSNTGYQRAMEDARQAGLNPMLMGKLGPASTPSGASASAGNEFSDVGASTAMELALNRATVDKAKAEANMAKKSDQWQREFAQWDIAKRSAEVGLLNKQMSVLTNSAINTQLQNDVLRVTLPKIAAEAKFHAGAGGTASRYIDLATKGIGTAAQLRGLLTPTLGPGFTSSKYFLGSKATGEIFNP